MQEKKKKGFALCLILTAQIEWKNKEGKNILNFSFPDILCFYLENVDQKKKKKLYQKKILYRS